MLPNDLPQDVHDEVLRRVEAHPEVQARAHAAPVGAAPGAQPQPRAVGGWLSWVSLIVDIAYKVFREKVEKGELTDPDARPPAA